QRRLVRVAALQIHSLLHEPAAVRLDALAYEVGGLAGYAGTLPHLACRERRQRCRFRLFPARGLLRGAQLRDEALPLLLCRGLEVELDLLFFAVVLVGAELAHDERGAGLAPFAIARPPELQPIPVLPALAAGLALRCRDRQRQVLRGYELHAELLHLVDD